MIENYSKSGFPRTKTYNWHRYASTGKSKFIYKKKKKALSITMKMTIVDRFDFTLEFTVGFANLGLSKRDPLA